MQGNKISILIFRFFVVDNFIKFTFIIGPQTRTRIKFTYFAKFTTTTNDFIGEHKN